MTLFLSASSILVKGNPIVKKWLRHEKLHVHVEQDRFGSTLNAPVRIQLYTLRPRFNIIQKYITGDHMLTQSYIFSGLISSMFVSYLYGLMRCILCVIFTAPYCNMNLPMVKHCVIPNGPWNGVLYFYAALLLSMTLSSALAVMVRFFTISMDYIWINLRLLLMTY